MMTQLNRLALAALVLMGCPFGETKPALVESPAQGSAPQFYGWYLRAEGGLKQIAEQSATWRSGLSGVCGVWGMEGLASTPTTTSSHPQPLFIVYKQNVDMSKMQLGRLTFVEEIDPRRLMKNPPDPPFFQNLCGVSPYNPLSLKLWMLSGTEPFEVGPVEGKQDMYQLRPKRELAGGVYAFFSGSFTGVARMRDVQRSVLIPFQVVGTGPATPQKESLPPEEKISLVIREAVVAQGIAEGLPIGASTRLGTGVRSLVFYLLVDGAHGGEVAEFIWYQPDGEERARSSVVFGNPRGRGTQYVFGRFNPRTVLIPGRWRAEVSIDGRLAKRVYFVIG